MNNWKVLIDLRENRIVNTYVCIGRLQIYVNQDNEVMVYCLPRLSFQFLLISAYR